MNWKQKPRSPSWMNFMSSKPRPSLPLGPGCRARVRISSSARMPRAIAVLIDSHNVYLGTSLDIHEFLMTRTAADRCRWPPGRKFPSAPAARPWELRFQYLRHPERKSAVAEAKFLERRHGRAA